jgi:hypothetical protein
MEVRMVDMRGRLWADCLPEIQAENAAWSAHFGPVLRARDEAQRLAREEAARLAAEQAQALEWCQANGNPHRRVTLSHHQKDD